MNDLHIGEFTQGMMRADGPDPDGFPRPSGGVPRIRRVIRVQADGTCVENGGAPQNEGFAGGWESWQPSAGWDGTCEMNCHCGNPPGPPRCPPAGLPLPALPTGTAFPLPGTLSALPALSVPARTLPAHANGPHRPCRPPRPHWPSGQPGSTRPRQGRKGCPAQPEA